VWPFSPHLNSYLYCKLTSHVASLTQCLLVAGQVSEGRIVAALRDEVTAAEVRLEEERAAHTSTQRTAAAREQVSHVFSVHCSPPESTWTPLCIAVDLMA